jgi:hypothetical protein
MPNSYNIIIPTQLPDFEPKQFNLLIRILSHLLDQPIYGFGSTINFIFGRSSQSRFS